MGTCCPQSSLDKSSSAGRHTIVLVQPSPNKTSKTFMDFSSLNQALDAACRKFNGTIPGRSVSLLWACPAPTPSPLLHW
nr:uncharacterized protein LOC109732593 isoform X3 [Aegilops tauschii subsp. strangulata]